MTRTNIEAKDGLWFWYHHVSECYYHVQITIKYRKSLFVPDTEKLMLSYSGFNSVHEGASTKISP